MNTAILLLDQQLLIRSANQAFFDMFQAAPEQVIGHKLPEFHHDDALMGELHTFFDRLVDHDRMNARIWIGPFQMGKHVNLSVSAYRLRQLHEDDMMVVVTFREQAIGSNLSGPDFLENQILNTVGQAVVMTDLDGRIFFWNKAAEVMYGWEANEVSGLRLQDIMPGVASAVQPESLMLHLSSRRNWTGEIVTHRRDGSEFPAYLSITPLLNGAGETEGIIGVSVDITERQREQAALLEVERLRIALSKEKELFGVKSKLMETIAHEFRTPLATIRASADMLQRYSDRMSPDSRTERLVRIQHQVEHIVDMIDDISFILESSRKEDRVPTEPVDLVLICQQVIGSYMSDEAVEHSIQLEVVGTPVLVQLNSVLIRRALDHLLSNAIKFSDSGKPIDVLLTFETARVALEVRDHGIGIPSGEFQHLLEAFQRASNVGATGGLGLGLTIVKNCVDMLDGKLHAQTEVGHGTTIRIELPLRVAHGAVATGSRDA